MLAPYRGAFGEANPLAELGLGDFFSPDIMTPFAFPQALSRTGDQFGQQLQQLQAKAPTMSVDVIEKDDAYLVHAEIPGVRKEDIDIRFDQGMLTITAEKKSVQEWRRGEGEEGQEGKDKEKAGAGGAREKKDVQGTVATQQQQQLQPSEGQQNWRWHHSERSYGRTKRTIRLPKDASEQDINARFENGVLELTVKKVPEEHRQAKKITIA